MTANRPTKKPASSAPGVKMLITAASLAATLGGWALISNTEANPVTIPAPAPEQATSRTVTIKLAPLPTLVPPITPQPQLVTINQPRSAASAPQPQPAPANVLVLRDVSAPQMSTGGSKSTSAPAPVVNTKSSR